MASCLGSRNRSDRTLRVSGSQDYESQQVGLEGSLSLQDTAEVTSLPDSRIRFRTPSTCLPPPPPPDFLRCATCAPHNGADTHHQESDQTPPCLLACLHVGPRAL